MQSPSTLLNSIRQHYLAGRIDEATELCLQGLTEAPQDGELHFLLALCDEKAGKINEAFERLQRVVEQHDQHVDARFALGRMQLSRGQARDARATFNELLELDPGHAPARTLRARLDRIEGRIDEAVNGLRTALRGDEHHVPALVSLAEIELERGNVEAANEHASQAVQIAPHDAAAQLVMGQTFLAKGLSSFAERALTNAAESDPGNPRIHLALGQAMQRFGRHREAVSAFERARSLGLQDGELARGLAVSLARSGRLADARKALEELEPDLRDRNLILDLAELHAADGDAPALAALGERAALIAPELNRWVLAIQCELEGRIDEGLALAEQLLDSEQTDLQVRARMLTARLHVRQGNAEATEAVLSPLLENPSLTPAAHWEIARLLRQVSAWEAAARCLERVAARKELNDEDRARSQAMRVDILDRAGRYDQAAALFPEAAWQPPYLGEPAYLELHGNQPHALSNVLEYDWKTPGDDDAGRTPLFVAGWPCSGRDLVLAALGQSPSLAILPLADWPQRKQHLDLPIDASRFGPADPSRVHLTRRRYGRHCPRDRRAVESASIQPVDMAQIARVFPDAVVVLPHARKEYLALQWRLVGYRQVPSMLKAWEGDQRLMELLRDQLPLRVIDCSLEDLLQQPEATLSDLCSQLGLTYDDGMREVVEQMAVSRGYRPPEHWRHYSPGS
jgi:tetratricopeptide (TPR) repeat protein